MKKKLWNAFTRECNAKISLAVKVNRIAHSWKIRKIWSIKLREKN